MKLTTVTQQAELGGVPFTITDTVLNSGSTPVTLSVPATLVDATVTTGATLDWQLSKVSGTLPGYEQQTLQPGGTITGSVVWNQTDLNGNHIPAGTYAISAWSPFASVNGTTFTMAQGQTEFATSPVIVTVE